MWATVGGLMVLCATVVAQGRQPSTIVFVCEHGSAKSVIAAAHFNRIAEGKKLPYRAISRGINPDPEIPAVIRAGLLGDGIDVSSWKPKLIDDDEFRRAERVVTLACEIPKRNVLDAKKKIDWTDLPAVSDGYMEARAAIVRHIEELIKSLATRD